MAQVLDAASGVDRHAGMLKEMALRIWQHPEMGLLEFQASALQAEALERAGFAVERGVAGIATALRASWGEGGPVIGMLGEFDALPGLSQAASAERGPTEAGAPGHGCGHNLLGTAALGAAIALKEALEAEGRAGTVVYFGCPAEESVNAKGFMARAGAFDGVDLCLYFHPMSLTAASLESCLATSGATFTFRGVAAHAAADPENGRSALDAVELMNVGVNYLREHVPSDVRIHYTITDGGTAPNVVPDRAASHYFVRARNRQNVDDAYARVVDCARGAALMTGTEVEVRLIDGLWNILPSRSVGRRLAAAMEALGPVPFDDAARTLARALQATLPAGAVAGDLARLRAAGWRPGEDEDAPLLCARSLGLAGEGGLGHYSTDAGDISWIVPTGFLSVATAPIGTPGHSWQNVAASGSSLGLTGMLYAAKTMALAAHDFVRDPALVAEAGAELAEATRITPYRQVVDRMVAPPHVPADAPWQAR